MRWPSAPDPSSTPVLFPGVLAAQGWQLQTSDDGSYFAGFLNAPAGVEISLVCGERSPQGLSPQETGNMEPDISAPNTLILYIGMGHIPAPQSEFKRQDVIISTGAQGYRIPELIWNELFGTWEARVAAQDALLQSMAASPGFEIITNEGRQPIPAAGFATGYDQLLGYCQSMFESSGISWDGTPPQPREQSDGGVDMRRVAEGTMVEGCNGDATTGENYLLSGDIDGDGIEDVVLDWREVECVNAPARPFCGASMCSADVFISSDYPVTGQPKNLLALGVKLIPLNNGNTGIITGGSMGQCNADGRNPCEYLYYWDGSDLALAP